MLKPNSLQKARFQYSPLGDLLNKKLKVDYTTDNVEEMDNNVEEMEDNVEEMEDNMEEMDDRAHRVLEN